MENIKTRHWQSPAGEMTIGSFKGRICLCDWRNGKKSDRNKARIKRCLKADYECGTSETVEAAIKQLEEFFAGERKQFTVPLLFTGSEFQNKVWNELRNIPYGDTISYAELARRTGNAKAVRAVASANASNPISIFVPCHRVIGSDGTLTGYGGGLEAKRTLLAVESFKNH